MTKRNSMAARLRYAFDTSMSAGPVALIGWLAVLSLIVIVIAAILLVGLQLAPEGQPAVDFPEAMWESLMRSMDAGTVAGDTGWGFRAIGLIVTIAGIFIFSTLIGVLSSGIEGKLDELRKGRSTVLEEDHTVILNWSPSIFDVIAELAVANRSRKKPRIVIMAERDKVEMEDAIAAKVPNLGRTRVICRHGAPTDIQDLAIVSPQHARSIIVLSPEDEDANHADSQVIKTLLALVNDPRRRAKPYRIAAEIRDNANAEVARVVGGTEAQLVLADDLIARIVAHSSRQAGLSAVYSELLDFDGCEIYTLEQQALTGNSFGDALMAYEGSTLIGLVSPDGQVELNPPMESLIPAGARAIIIAEDDAAIAIAAAAISVDPEAIRHAAHRPDQPERVLLLGWNRRAPIIVHELSRYVAEGSMLTIAADTPDLDDVVAGLSIASSNLSVEYGRLDTTSRAALDSLDIAAYDHVLVLGYSDILAPQPTDTSTLVTLLHLRKIADAAGVHINVVSEMVDVRNRELAEVTRADDFVVSNKLVSLMLAQASENDSLGAIFDDLLDEEGSEIYMRPAEDYVALGMPVNFYTVTQAARERGEVAIGYHRPREGAKANGILVNPRKSAAVDYLAGDRLIVLARD
ncbi:Castor and Pollux, part of voltage-gated ion channel [Devosia sp. YR412]|uniref:CASTOR/POLLUX-related putative ion channel n=1 Tax=Devosia sp. YR412 TaxID=1881030 RepID=UPI0008CEF228|nr:hypothetical protein [Devosia sp. YR412]SEP67037.1 Castor and Pollux, part of voltage-gated ion channel [Devosia sp. YR412]